MTGSHGGFDAVAEVGQAYEAELIALRLRDAGIEAQVLDQSYRQEPLPSVRAFALVRVLVPIEQVAEAKRVLAQGEPLPKDAEEADPRESHRDTKAQRE
jgi:hypothetical protein